MRPSEQGAPGGINHPGVERFQEAPRAMGVARAVREFGHADIAVCTLVLRR